MIIDFHTHCFPDNIAQKAIPKLAGIGGIPYYTDGTIDTNLAAMKESGVDHAVVLNIATNLRQMTNVNNFAISVNNNYPNLTALGSVNPDCEPEIVSSELSRLHEAGIIGIKIHPDYMECPIDDDKFKPIFAKCCELDMLVVTHAGWDFISPDFIHATPERIVRVLDNFPSLRLVCAHMGAHRQEQDVLKLLVGRNVWFDTSLVSYSMPDKKLVRQIIMNHDPEKLLFGTDTPWCRITSEREYIDSLELPAELANRIFYKNAATILKLDI